MRVSKHYSKFFDFWDHYKDNDRDYDNRLLYTYTGVSASSVYGGNPFVQKEIAHERCSYCGNKMKEDSRGNCSSCGGGA